MGDLTFVVKKRTEAETNFAHVLEMSALGHRSTIVCAFPEVTSREKGIGLVVDRNYVFGNQNLSEEGCHYDSQIGLERDFVKDALAYLGSIIDGSFEVSYVGLERGSYLYSVKTTPEFDRQEADFVRESRKKGYLR